MQTLLLIDGNAIFHRAYYALPDFKTRSGLHTNAVYGFFAMLHKAISDFKPTHVVIAFDTPKPTFRVKLLPAYQAQRPSAPAEFAMQFPMVREAIDAAGIIRIEKDGFEADDVIGTLSVQYKKEDFKVIILTGDRDIMQLVDKNVFVVTPQKGLSSITIYDKEEVVKKMGLTPDKIPDLKGLMGDPSDNYTGAVGVGPKTAIKLIQEFDSVENLYKNFAKIPEGRLKQILEEHKKNVLLSKKLATIICDVPVESVIDKATFHGFNPKLGDVFDKFEIRSLKARLLKNQPTSREESKASLNRPTEKKEKKKEDSTDQIDMFS